MLLTDRPAFSISDAETLARELFGVEATAVPLPSERDQNFALTLAPEAGAEAVVVTRPARRAVLKIAHPDERRERLEFENVALDALQRSRRVDRFPHLILARDGRTLVTTTDHRGTPHFIRLVSWLPGSLLADEPRPSPNLLRDLGATIAAMDRTLASLQHPAMMRVLYWDPASAPVLIERVSEQLADVGRRALVRRVVSQFEDRVGPHLLGLRRGVIHNDVNDHNVLVLGDRVTGLFDFGDMLFSYVVNDVAVACAYAMLGKDDPRAIARALIDGYQTEYPLTPVEIEVLPAFIQLRLALSVTISAGRQKDGAADPYLLISEAPAWALLERLDGDSPDTRRRDARRPTSDVRWAKPDLVTARRRRIGPNLSVAYREPLEIVRGDGVHLYDETGRAYLDCVNNVCHVGHGHPRVVEAIARQAATLNTNTRYLHPHIIDYARRLTSTLPASLEVCFFVNSGSEANDLALRLARLATGREDVLVVDHAYHGHTRALIDISPYKFNGKGGQGRPARTHIAPMPDTYRGIYKAGDRDAGMKYARLAQRAIDAAPGIAAFITESLLSCGGQIVLPPGYLAEVFHAVRSAGGVCIADEVQVGFGRVGSHFWGFQTHHVVPDIVTFGKPAGNGHPLAGVVTTRGIADRFANGMEYFNTFGGNPVSCAAGLAVLDVIDAERLQEHAASVGAYFVDQLTELQGRHPIIGDVRGRGLFIGVELVTDRATLAPATREASDLINEMCRRGILLSADGPLDNVIKIKPPLVFTRENVDQVIATLDDVLPALHPD
jgi:4-aminobutyrate aminotransferase-like enzyme/tRNA A-37 threonylcarbamoyl transferase component Bud32